MQQGGGDNLKSFQQHIGEYFARKERLWAALIFKAARGPESGLGLIELRRWVFRLLFPRSWYARIALPLLFWRRHHRLLALHYRKRSQ